MNKSQLNPIIVKLNKLIWHFCVSIITKYFILIALIISLYILI